MGGLDFSQYLSDYSFDDLVYLFEVEFSYEHIKEFLKKQDGMLRDEMFLNCKTPNDLRMFFVNRVSKQQLKKKLLKLSKDVTYMLMTDEETYYRKAKSKLILKTFWTAEEMEAYKKIGCTKYVKWGIAKDYVLFEFAANCVLFEVGYKVENNYKYYFHEDFYLAQIVKDNRIVLGIGRDANKKYRFVKRMNKKEKKERAEKMAKEIIEQYGDVFKKLANE
jgi:hypothetical protein